MFLFSKLPVIQFSNCSKQVIRKLSTSKTTKSFQVSSKILPGTKVWRSRSLAQIPKESHNFARRCLSPSPNTLRNVVVKAPLIRDEETITLIDNCKKFYPNHNNEKLRSTSPNQYRTFTTMSRNKNPITYKIGVKYRRYYSKFMKDLCNKFKNIGKKKPSQEAVPNMKMKISPESGTSSKTRLDVKSVPLHKQKRVTPKNLVDGSKKPFVLKLCTEKSMKKKCKSGSKPEPCKKSEQPSDSKPELSKAAMSISELTKQAESRMVDKPKKPCEPFTGLEPREKNICKGDSQPKRRKSEPTLTITELSKQAQRSTKADPCKEKDPCAKPPPCKKICPKPDPCAKPDPCKKADPCAKAIPCPCPKPDPCKKPVICPCPKSAPCPKRDPCKKADPCTKPDPCAKAAPCPCPKPDPCKKADPCPKPDPCKKADPCKKPDPYKKADPCPKPDPCAKAAPCPCPKPRPSPCPKPDPCKKVDPCKTPNPCKKADPCKKPDPCAKAAPCPCPKPPPSPCPKLDPCKKADPCKKPDPCKKTDPCPKPDPCVKAAPCPCPKPPPSPCPKPDPCKKADPCKKPDPCKKADPCAKPDPCAKAAPCPCPKPPPTPCPKPDPCKKADPCPKPDPCKKAASCSKADPCPKPKPCPPKKKKIKPDGMEKPPCKPPKLICKKTEKGTVVCKKPPIKCCPKFPFRCPADCAKPKTPCPDSCKKPKPDPCKKKDPCPKPDPCKKKDPCPKSDPSKKKDPCPKPDPCKKKDPCPKPDPCKKKDPCPKPDPCKKKDSCPKPDPCKKKNPCPKPDPCKKADPCKKPAPCPCPKLDVCKKADPCCPKPSPDPCAPKPNPCKPVKKQSVLCCGSKPKPNDPCEPKPKKKRCANKAKSLSKSSSVCCPTPKPDPCAPKPKSDPCCKKPDPCNDKSKRGGNVPRGLPPPEKPCGAPRGKPKKPPSPTCDPCTPLPKSKSSSSCGKKSNPCDSTTKRKLSYCNFPTRLTSAPVIITYECKTIEPNSERFNKPCKYIGVPLLNQYDIVTQPRVIFPRINCIEIPAVKKDPGTKNEHKDPGIHIKKMDPMNNHEPITDLIDQNKFISEDPTLKKNPLIAKKFKRSGLEGDRSVGCLIKPCPCNVKPPCTKKEIPREPCKITDSCAADCKKGKKKEEKPQAAEAVCKGQSCVKRKFSDNKEICGRKSKLSTKENKCQPEKIKCMCRTAPECGKRTGCDKACSIPCGKCPMVKPESCGVCEKSKVYKDTPQLINKKTECVAKKCCQKQQNCPPSSPPPPNCCQPMPKQQRLPPCCKVPTKVGPCLKEPKPIPEPDYPKGACGKTPCKQKKCKKKKVFVCTLRTPKPIIKPAKKKKCKSDVKISPSAKSACAKQKEKELKEKQSKVKDINDSPKHTEWKAVEIKKTEKISTPGKKKPGKKASCTSTKLGQTNAKYIITKCTEFCSKIVIRKRKRPSPKLDKKLPKPEKLPKDFIEGTKGLVRNICDAICPGKKGGKGNKLASGNIYQNYYVSPFAHQEKILPGRSDDGNEMFSKNYLWSLLEKCYKQKNKKNKNVTYKCNRRKWYKK